MTETTVSADLLQALEIVTELGVDTVGEDLAVLAIDDVALSVEEPGGDLVLGGVLDDGDDTLKLFGGKLSGTVKAKRVSNLFCARLQSPMHTSSQSSPMWPLDHSIHFPQFHLPSPTAIISGHSRNPLLACKVGAGVRIPLVEIDIGLLADQVGVPATDTLDLGQGVHDLLLAVDIGVEKTEDELEVRLLAAN